MEPAKVVFTEPPPSLKGVWRRMLLAMSVVLAIELAAILLWRREQWPDPAAIRAIVLGFGIAFGARYGSTGRLGGQTKVQIVIGAISAALFYVLFVMARS